MSSHQCCVLDTLNDQGKHCQYAGEPRACSRILFRHLDEANRNDPKTAEQGGQNKDSSELRRLAITSSTVHGKQIGNRPYGNFNFILYVIKTSCLHFLQKSGKASWQKNHFRWVRHLGERLFMAYEAWWKRADKQGMVRDSSHKYFVIAHYVLDVVLQ